MACRWPSILSCRSHTYRTCPGNNDKLGGRAVSEKHEKQQEALGGEPCLLHGNLLAHSTAYQAAHHNIVEAQFIGGIGGAIGGHVNRMLSGWLSGRERRASVVDSDNKVKLPNRMIKMNWTTHLGRRFRHYSWASGVSAWVRMDREESRVLSVGSCTMGNGLLCKL